MILAVETLTSLPFLVTLGAIIAALAGGWSQIKGFFQWIRGLLFIHVSIEEGSPLQNAIRLYCIKHYKEYTLGSRSFNAFFQLVYSIRRSQLIGIETLAPQGCIYWNGWRPLLMKRTMNKEGYSRGAALTFIRGLWDIDKFMESAVDHYNDSIGSCASSLQRHKIVYIFGRNKQKLELDLTGERRGQGCNSGFYDNIQEYYLNNKLIKWEIQDLIPARHKTTLSDLFLSKKAREMVELANKWISHEDWFYSHRVPWRMGVLLHGEPGTGKTALIRALAQELDLPVYVFDLASLTNEELFHAWRQMLANSPCIALIEDMDSVFEGRKNVTGVEGALTFNSLLNCIDGIERCDGLFLAVTTNKAELIDPAIGVIKEGDKLASRPGRIDYIIEMPRLIEEGRFEIAARILKDCPECIKRIVEEGKGDTGAQFQARCQQLAVSSFVNGDDKI